MSQSTWINDNALATFSSRVQRVNQFTLNIGLKTVHLYA